MPALSLQLLGGFHARVGDGPVLGLPTKKTQALLAYLALPAGREHPRETLTTLLWGDAGERQARHSLRQALFTLRRTLGGGAADVLVEGETIAVNPRAVEVDVASLERLAADGSPAALARIVDLYQGDLLEGLSVPEAAFDEWLAAERERVRETARRALARLLGQQSGAGQVEAAIRTAGRLLALDPYQEAVHRALMRLYARDGRRAAALRQYQACVALLRRELGVEPDRETRQVYQDVLQRESGAPAPPEAPLPGSRTQRPPPALRREAPALEAPLVGRDAELAWLSDTLASAWTGDGGVLLLLGEAGAGKSRLVAELAAEALRRDGRVLLGVSHESEQVLPFRPWVDALRAGYAADPDALAALSPAWRAELARLFPDLGAAPPPPTSVEDCVRLFDAVRALVTRLAERAPLLLVLEDLHWADEMSVRLLGFLGRRLQGHPVLLVGTVREEEVEDTPLLGQALQELDRESQLARLVLPPLSRADTARLVHALARGRHEATADALVEPVWALSDGNPFAIVESMREAQEPPPGPVDGVPFPRRVREMIDARLRRLGERSRQLAAAVAVAGGEASFGLLRELTGFDGPPAAEAIEELVRRRVLDAVGDGFDFTHDRIRGIVYAGLLPETRQRLHAALGEALESRHAARLDEVADRLAYHYARAERADKAVTYLTRFADAAAGRYALDEAARALHDAQALAERLPDPERTRRLVDLVVRRATCLYLLGRGRELLELLESHEARFEGLADLALLAPFHVWHGYAHGTVGDQARAIQLHERAIDAATRCGDVATLGMAHAGLARECFWAGRCAQAIEHGREAVALLTRTAERWWLGHAHWTLGISHAFRGEFAAALAAEAEARAIGSALGNSRLQGYATWATGWIRSLLGEHAAAIEACRESLALSQDAFNTAFGLGYLGYACLAAGDADQATSHLRDSVERLTQLRMTRSAARVSTWLAEAHFARGEVTEAGSAATRALEATTAAQHRYGMGEAARVLGRIALATGALETAGTRLDEALAIFTGIEARFEVARTHLARAELRERRGDAAGAAADLAEAGRLFERLGLSDRVLRARGAGP